jgi:hypothetical protein
MRFKLYKNPNLQDEIRIFISFPSNFPDFAMYEKQLILLHYSQSHQTDSESRKGISLEKQFS